VDSLWNFGLFSYENVSLAPQWSESPCPPVSSPTISGESFTLFSSLLTPHTSESCKRRRKKWRSPRMLYLYVCFRRLSLEIIILVLFCAKAADSSALNYTPGSHFPLLQHQHLLEVRPCCAGDGKPHAFFILIIKTVHCCLLP
jgi:hypothetical protein